MRPSIRRGRAMLAFALALLFVASSLAASTESAASEPPPAIPAGSPRPWSAPTGTGPRLAYTDDSDEIVRESAWDCDESDSIWDCGVDPDVLEVGDPHAGEASLSGDDLVYVSDRDEASGEVYLQRDLSDVTPVPMAAQRITCDTSTETHPVLSPDGTKVAYASNAGGGWSIWVVWLTSEGDGDTGPPPMTCPDLPRAKIADGPGDELWPTWLGDGVVAFSRSGVAPLDPLGDLYAAPLGDRGKGVPPDAAVQLTKGSYAETQPTAFRTGSRGEGEGQVAEYAVVFTTTQFRLDGSLAGIGGLTQSDLGVRNVTSLWPKDHPVQSTEASYLQWNKTERIGFTTTRDDPFGDVFSVNLKRDEVDLGFSLIPESVEPVSAESGRAESHLAFAPTSESSSTQAVYTRRSLSADVSDLVAADGSARRRVAAGFMDVDNEPVVLDESTPTYSPDGSRIAYSRTTQSGREIVTAAADGSDVRPLLQVRPPGALDLEPAWSPDGTRIAFVRFLKPEEGYGSSQIFVATVATGAASLVTVQPENTEVWDENPSWSPDGKRLVIARRVAPFPDFAVEVSAPATATRGTAVLATVAVANRGGAARTDATVHLTSRFPLGTKDARCTQLLPTRLECHYGVLPPGEAPELSVSVTPDVAAAGSITAEITASEDESDYSNNRSQAAIAVSEPPDVGVEVQLPGRVLGDTAQTATVTVSAADGSGSTGPFTVHLETGTPAESTGRLEFSATGQPANCERDSASSAHCSVASLNPGDSVDLAVSVVGRETGVASVSASVAALPGELRTDDNRSDDTTTVWFAPDIDVGLAVPAFIRIRTTATATVTLTNLAALGFAGRFPVRLTISQQQTGGAVDFAATGLPNGCVDQGSTLRCDVAGLGAGRSLTLPVPIVAERTGRVTLIAEALDVPDESVLSNNRVEQVTDVTDPDRPRKAWPFWSRLTSPPGRGVVGLGRASSAGRPAGFIPPSMDRVLVGATRSGVAGGRVLPRAVRALDQTPAVPEVSHLWIIDATTGAGHPLAVPADPDCPLTTVCKATPVEGRVPAWSPDGLTVAYEHDGNVLIATLTDADHDKTADRPETVTRTAAVTGFRADGEPTPSRPQLEAATDPAWSPDGSELAVAGQPAGQPDQSGIYGIHPDGTGLRTIAQQPGPETEPVWQPVVRLVVAVSTTTPGYVGGSGTTTVTVTNPGPPLAAQATLAVRHPDAIVAATPALSCLIASGGCPVGPLAHGASATFTAATGFLAAGRGEVTATLSSPSGEQIASTTLTVLQPAIRVSANATAPNSVLLVDGIDFPPGTKVVLSWDVGIMQRMDPVKVKSDGTIRPLQVVIFRRDQLGMRNLIATGETAGSFTPVSTPLLVAPRSVSPPNFVERN